MTNEQLIEKVKKLLELSTSSNENEARLAFSRAQDLIAKYSLDLAGSNTPESIIEMDYVLKIKSAGIKDSLHNIVDTIAQVFSCHSLRFRSSGNIRIFGFATNVKIAEYAIDSVINQLNVDFKVEFQKHRTIAFSGAFWKSASDALSIKFAPQSSTGVGMILYDKTRDYINQKYKVGTATNFQGDSSYAAGHSAGSKSGSSVQIRSGVSQSGGGKLLN